MLPSESAARVREWIDTLSGTDPSASRQRMEAAGALAGWLQDDAISVEERVGVIESLPERLAMFELGKVLVPVIDSATPLALRAPAVRAFATTGNVNVL